MEYTKLETKKNVTVQRILPLNQKIVQIKLSARVPGYRKELTDEAINLFIELSLTGTKKRSKDDITSFLDRNGIEFSVNGAVKKRGDVVLRALLGTSERKFNKEVDRFVGQFFSIAWNTG